MAGGQGQTRRASPTALRAITGSCVKSGAGSSAPLIAQLDQSAQQIWMRIDYIDPRLMLIWSNSRRLGSALECIASELQPLMEATMSQFVESFQCNKSWSQIAGICVLIVASLVPFTAAAQEGATCGMIETPNGPMFGGACPGGGLSQPVILHWAAVAISSSSLRVGASHGRSSGAEAKQIALQNCGGAAKGCMVLNWGSNICFGLAVSRPDSSYAQAPAENRAAAQAAALAGCRAEKGKACVIQTTPCASDNVNWSSPLPLPLPPATPAAKIDPAVVGTWEYSINPGRWVWQIAANGTYEFHSEAADPAPSHSGVFSASGGHWSLKSTSGFEDIDGGQYKFESSSVMTATGKLGTAKWSRVSR
jgi:hypothetical protein